MGLTPSGGLIMGTRSGEQAVGCDVDGVLDGVDTIVFTGGIGEHDAAVRAEVCAGLSSLGVRLDGVRHRALAKPISSDSSNCEVHVLPSLGDEQIARHARALVGVA